MTTSTAGVFSEHARQAILESGLGRCAGCGRTDVTTQHRRARGMGGTDNLSIGHPANGVPLCGDGTRGCHGWAEHNPTDAALLGWRLAPGEDALTAPWLNLAWGGWVRWVEQETEGPRPYVGIELLFASLGDVDRALERRRAINRYRLARPLPALKPGKSAR